MLIILKLKYALSILICSKFVLFFYLMYSKHLQSVTIWVSVEWSHRFHLSKTHESILIFVKVIALALYKI